MGVSTPPIPRPPEEAGSAPTQPGGEEQSIPPSNATIPAEGGTSAPPRVDPRDLEGKPFGRYRLLRELGRGGMGVVWLAWDPHLRRHVALKQVRQGDGAGDAMVERFIREAQLAAKLRHPGIVVVHDAGVCEGAYYFTSEYIEGQSLEERMKHPLSPRQAATWTKAVAEALHHAHENGVVHRDVKPGNILLDSAERPYVGDFGIAKEVRIEPGSGSSLRTLTVSGVILGTPGYMSPEQASARTEAIGPPSDQFSLGVVLYELLTGHPPFEGKGLQDLLKAIVEQDPRKPRRWNASLHADLETICLCAIEKDPLLRYPSLAAMAADLGRFLEGESIRARPVTILESMARRVWRRPRTAIAFVVGAAAIGGLLCFAASSREAEKDWRLQADVARVRRERAEEVARKSALAQEVLARWTELAADLDTLFATANDSTLGDAERAKRLAKARRPFERFAAETASDATSQVTMLSLLWWVRALAGELPSNLELRELHRMDPELPYPALVESAVLFGELLRERASRLGSKSTGGAGSASRETKFENDLENMLEVRTAEVLGATVWGAGHASQFFAWGRAMDAYTREDYQSAWEASEQLILSSTLRAFRRDLLLARAWSRLERGQGELALADVEEYLRCAPEHAPSHRVVGWLALDLARDELRAGRDGRAAATRAEEAFTGALSRDEGLHDARLQRGMARILLGKLRDAEADLTEVVAVDERNALAWSLRSSLRKVRGDLQGGLEDVGRAIELEPDNAGLLLERGPLRLQLGDTTGAIEDLDRAVGLAPEDPVAWANRGALRSILGEIDKAIADFEKALSVAPADWPMRGEAEARLEELKRR